MSGGELAHPENFLSEESDDEFHFVVAETGLFTYAIGHCLLMLAAGTFTGFVESFVKARGIVNFSLWTKRAGGVVVAAVGAYLLWRA